MTTDEVYIAIKANDVEAVRTFLTDTKIPAGPKSFDLLKSLLGYAIDQEKIDVVKVLVCEAGISKHTLNNWFVKWSWYIRPNYEIWKFLTDQCLDA